MGERVLVREDETPLCLSSVGLLLLLLLLLATVEVGFLVVGVVVGVEEDADASFFPWKPRMRWMGLPRFFVSLVVSSPP